MAGRKSNTQTKKDGTTQQIASSAVGAAQALSVGVLRLTQATLIELLHAVEDIGNELGSTVVRATRASIKAAEDIGGDLFTVAKGASEGVAEHERQGGDGLARLTKGAWPEKSQLPAAGRSKNRGYARKGPAKAAGRRRRRTAA
jgi:hypothetical protein